MSGDREDHTAHRTAEQAPEVSVVIPLGSRFEDLDTLCRSLRSILAPHAGRYEVIFVDDATGPQTRARIAAAAARCPESRLIRLHRVMGEATALAIGAQAARGAILVTLDPYLHVALEELPRLLTALDDGMDLVCAWRHPRRESWLGRATSAAFNASARWLTGVPVHDLNCRVRVMRRAVLEELPLYGDLHRFLPVFAARRGYRWCEVQVPQQPGKQELRPLGLRFYIQRLLDLVTLAFLTRFVKRPLHFFGLVGVASVAVGVVINLHLAYVRLVTGAAIGHRPLLLLGALLVVVGVQVASIGLLGELLIFTHARQIRDYAVWAEDDRRDA